ncbi:rho guanine nucleotide exchange factor 33 [Scleropages formosus]|uniref:rho guanine nucleotide exchange factor 33 n=1 Tax=Scleropages formosus TaxID=113540 RepID=UPI0010FA9010|nr:rho guanine nucleotide exchange factor 33 [Scleropages formosus]
MVKWRSSAGLRAQQLTARHRAPSELQPPSPDAMENGKPEDQDSEMEEVNLQIAQLQAMAMELKAGLMGAIQELSVLKQQDGSLEERMMSYQGDVDEKILGIKNSLNTFKEDLSTALSQIKEINSRHKEMQRGLELFQLEVGRELLSAQQRKAELKDDPLADGPKYPQELSIIQHYFSSLPNGSGQKHTTSVPSTNSEQDGGRPQQMRGASRSPLWRERRDSRDTTDGQESQENGKRQTAALELLESERVYVSYLSLLLKANITFNGSETVHVKDKRPFPSSLRFLIQQHLELLHILQERVLKCQWQGIMGDVFMRLTSKESDFLDYYVAYLKELPECLSALNMYSAASLKAASLSEADIVGDEMRPPLHTLLLQPVQRIPEYLLLLQNLLKQTDVEHPDYYLLLVCIQQFRAFTGQYSHLLQHNEDLLLQNRKELKRSAMKQLFRTVDCGVPAEQMGSPFPTSNGLLQHANQVKRSKQRLLEQMQCKRFQDWEADPRHYNSQDGASPVSFYASEMDPRLKSPALQSIPEADQESATVEPPACRRLPPGSVLADATGHFLLPGATPSLEGLYEDGDSLHNVSLFDHCSSASSDSSIDIAFVRCPKSHVREPYPGGSSSGSRDGGYKYPNRGSVSPDETGLMRHRSLQAVQRKSKSLNGLQLDTSTVSDGSGPADLAHPKGHSPHGSQQHTKVERQSSKGSANRKLQRSLSPLQRVDAESCTTTEEELRRDHDKEPTGQVWPEETKWRGGTEENSQAAFSERGRKQDQKGGFRSSFKKLFKKKSGGDCKDKGSEKSESQAYSDHESTKTPRITRLGDVDRGTAV